MGVKITKGDSRLERQRGEGPKLRSAVCWSGSVHVLTAAMAMRAGEKR